MVHEAGKPEVDAAVAAAKAALKGPWGKAVGGRALQHARRHRRRDQQPLRRLPAGRDRRHRQAGLPASHIDIPARAANFKIFTDTIKNVSTESFEMRTRRQDRPQLRRAHPARRDRDHLPVEPPLLLMTWKCGPAHCCGNTVVVKPSEPPRAPPPCWAK